MTETDNTTEQATVGTPFLELRGVEKRFRDNQVLNGIDLTVAEHEVVSLIGASGCGKSTLLRCVNALEPIQAGTITLQGQLVSGKGVDVDRHRRDVGIVFQSFNLFPHMTVLQNITLAPRQVLGLSRQQAEERADALLNRVGLSEKRKQYPDSLSGGQQQRVAIVRALAMRPKLLLLDEITSALDPELVAEVLNIVRELAHEGMTMLLATHEMSFAREVSSRVCFLADGVICEQGPPEQMFTEPSDPRTQAFLKRIIAAGRL
ncbi:MAG TPA: amino acid ABC transporter ATP-binding protein, partial [Actinomycetes bacterium]|nr:amino acid ABC transporter ATP-binding protein [Actinomycetes bacterium]